MLFVQIDVNFFKVAFVELLEFPKPGEAGKERSRNVSKRIGGYPIEESQDKYSKGEQGEEHTFFRAERIDQRQHLLWTQVNLRGQES